MKMTFAAIAAGRDHRCRFEDNDPRERAARPRRRRGWWNHRWGAIVGGAVAASRPAYGGPVYVEDAPPPPCRWVQERFWDGYNWRFRRVEVCN